VNSACAREDTLGYDLGRPMNKSNETVGDAVPSIPLTEGRKIDLQKENEHEIDEIVQTI